MGWMTTEWACGHTGKMQLYGKMAKRDSHVAYEAGRKCMACWLLDKWQEDNDVRAKRPDRWDMAVTIARGRGIRIGDQEIVAVAPPVDAPPVDDNAAEVALARGE